MTPSQKIEPKTKRKYIYLSVFSALTLGLYFSGPASNFTWLSRLHYNFVYHLPLQGFSRTDYSSDWLNFRYLTSQAGEISSESGTDGGLPFREIYLPYGQRSITLLRYDLSGHPKKLEELPCVFMKLRPGMDWLPGTSPGPSWANRDYAKLCDKDTVFKEVTVSGLKALRKGKNVFFQDSQNRAYCVFAFYPFDFRSSDDTWFLLESVARLVFKNPIQLWKSRLDQFVSWFLAPAADKKADTRFEEVVRSLKLK